MSRRCKICLVGTLLLTQSFCGGVPETIKSTSIKTPQPTATVTRPRRTMTTTPKRLFLVVFDSSKSYKDHEAAIRGLIAALVNLGPGDQLIVARITDRLNPRDFLIAGGDWSANQPDEVVFKRTKNVEEWKKRQRILSAVWQEADDSSQQLVSTLEREKTANTALLTDLHGALEYSALWLDGNPGAEKTLIVCSDLENDTGKPSFDPPAKSLAVNQMHIRLLFVSYRDAEHWQKLESAWRKYFSNALSFTMLDSGRSPSSMIAPSTTPRTIDHPFLTRSDH